MRIKICLLSALFLWGCVEDGFKLSARKITNPSELIGGPSAYGKVGDYIIENDKVRFIIGNAESSWGFGLYGGSLLDADLNRWEPEFRNGNGLDHFAESFPTVNLLVPNPTETEIQVIKDGSDGKEAVVRVAGRGAFLFNDLSILRNDLVKLMFPTIKMNFSFKTDYTLTLGVNYLKITTTIEIPQGDEETCGKLECDKICKDGFRIDDDGKDGDGCPICECNFNRELPYYTEPSPIFFDILGDFPFDPMAKYKAGIVGGDFLYFGASTDAFAPGIGFDEEFVLYENFYQGIDTLSSPLVFDFLAGLNDDRNVSYVYFTARRDQKPVEECKYEIILLGFPPDKSDELIESLKGIGISENLSKLALTAVLKQDVHFTLKTGLKKEEVENEIAELMNAIGVEGVILGSRLESECRHPKLLIPLFASSATVAIGSGLNCLISEEDNAVCDGLRTFTYERYLGVGEGDIASALTSFYRTRGIETGLVKGVVVESRTGKPISKADIFVFSDPDPSKEFGSYEELVRENKKKFRSVGLLSQMTTDVGVDRNLNGEFEGELPEGSYLLMVRVGNRTPSKIVRVKVEKGKTVTVNFELAPPAFVNFMVVDENGYLTPAKLTFVSLDEHGNPLTGDGNRKVALGDSRYSDGIRNIIHSHTGTDEIEIEPGRYRVYVSKGFEYSIDVFDDVVLESGRVKKLYAQLIREVDTSGWISGDYHLHANPSLDSGLLIEERVINSVVEGLEFITSTDHDMLTDYGPTVKELMLENRIASQVGVELTTIELGHYQGFPLKYDQRDLPSHGAINWVCMDIPTIFHHLREKGEFGYEETIVQVNHPRGGGPGSLFDQIGLNPYTLNREESGLRKFTEPNILLRKVSCDFDAIELLNGKNLELHRTPTVEEINDFNSCLWEINTALDKSKVAGACTWMKKWKECLGLAGERPKYCMWYENFEEELKKCKGDISLADCQNIARSALMKLSVRALIERTPVEQELIQKAIEKGAASDKCSLKVSLDPAKREALSDEERNSPCSEYNGVIDDWFNLLNHGVTPTALGNSDSHDAFYEAGYPMSYVKSSSDLPGGLDRRELMKSIKNGAVKISSGPFISFRINGADIGDTVSAPEEIRLYVQVQTPSWFGIDRIEIYRNGGLFKFIELDNPVEVIEDYEEEIILKKGDADFPTEDSWFVVIAYGVEERNFLSPLYTSIPLGKLLLPRVLSLALSKLPLVGDMLKEFEQPLIADFYPPLPYSVTNPIWVDVDGDKEFKFLYDRPLFCSHECTVVRDENGKPLIEQSDCPKGYVCYPGDELGRNLEGEKGTCGVYIEGECVAGEVGITVKSRPLIQN